MNFLKKFGITAGLIICGINPATASLLDIEDYGSFTRDTISGLDWLDLTETVNMSYDSVSSQTGTGGSFEGWRYASSIELSSFWDNAGGNSSIQGFSTVHEGQTDIMLDFLGITQVYGTSGLYTSNRATGILSDGAFNRFSNEIEHLIGTIQSSTDLSGTGMYGTDKFDASEAWVAPDYSHSAYGSFLVRDYAPAPTTSQVPEPPSFLLLAIGLLGFMVSSGMKKKNIRM